MAKSVEARLTEICNQWVRRHEISCPESIYQRDDVQESLCELAEKLCSVVGYYEHTPGG